jgi:hypothetical protein
VSNSKQLGIHPVAEGPSKVVFFTTANSTILSVSSSSGAGSGQECDGTYQLEGAPQVSSATSHEEASAIYAWQSKQLLRCRESFTDGDHLTAAISSFASPHSTAASS